MMKRIDIKKNLFFKKQTNFIGSWNIDNDDLCKEIINFFEENKDLQTQGATSDGVNQSIKKTVDLKIKPNDLKSLKFKCINNYINELHKCFTDYKNQWPFLKSFIKNVDIGSFNIQKYSPGDHFAQMHTERSSLKTLHRVFAWMTYLNDVDDGGKTNYMHYDVKIKPKIGKTLIWPAEWTHAHNGEVLNSGVKYILTGWMHFPFDEDKN